MLLPILRYCDRYFASLLDEGYVHPSALSGTTRVPIDVRIVHGKDVNGGTRHNSFDHGICIQGAYYHPDLTVLHVVHRDYIGFWLSEYFHVHLSFPLEKILPLCHVVSGTSSLWST